MSDDPIITSEISMYPLDGDVEPPIITFIHALRGHPGVEVVTNAMSTQVRGRFTDVQQALSVCMKAVLAREERVVFVTKTLNVDLAIDQVPDLG